MYLVHMVNLMDFNSPQRRLMIYLCALAFPVPGFALMFAAEGTLVWAGHWLMFSVTVCMAASVFALAGKRTVRDRLFGVTLILYAALVLFAAIVSCGMA